MIINHYQCIRSNKLVCWGWHRVSLDRDVAIAQRQYCQLWLQYGTVADVSDVDIFLVKSKSEQVETCCACLSELPHTALSRWGDDCAGRDPTTKLWQLSLSRPVVARLRLEPASPPVPIRCQPTITYCWNETI